MVQTRKKNKAVTDKPQALRLVIQTKGTRQKVADEPQAQWLVCGSDQQHRRPSPVARGPDAGTTKGLITTWLPAAALDKIELEDHPRQSSERWDHDVRMPIVTPATPWRCY